jgi:hypothetical protein
MCVAVTSMLQGLTGWNLSYFAIVSKFKSKKKRFGSKTYGRSDTMLWEKEVTDTAGVKRRGAAVTFRIHEEGELIWVSGMITLSTKIETSSGSDATIMVSNKTSGKLLHVGRMTAIAEESPSGHKHSRSTSDAHEDYSDLVVSFENSKGKQMVSLDFGCQALVRHGTPKYPRRIKHMCFIFKPIMSANRF